MRFTVDVHELIVQGRFGPLQRGATQSWVRTALGEPDTRSAPGALVEPASIWVYGKSLCRGHLEFHFLADDLWMIFADYLPLRPYRCPQFCFTPGCLGGLTYPSVAAVRAALAKPGAVDPVLATSDPRWSDPPPPPDRPRIATRLWNKAVRQAGALDADLASYGTLTWPTGAVLDVGYHHATSAAGERLVSEDVVLVVTVPMLSADLT